MLLPWVLARAPLSTTAAWGWIEARASWPPKLGLERGIWNQWGPQICVLWSGLPFSSIGGSSLTEVEPGSPA